MDGRIMKSGGNFRKVHVALPDQLLALLDLDPSDILTGRDLQVLMEQGSHIAGADIYHPRHVGYRQFFPDMGADILLCPADDLVF